MGFAYAGNVEILAKKQRWAYKIANERTCDEGYLQTKSVWINNGSGGGNPFIMKTAG
jgi:hypothetical protein